MNPFQNLPPEIKAHISSYLNVEELKQYSLVCKDSNEIANDYHLWKPLVEIEFGNRNPNSETNWKESYFAFFRQRYNIGIHASRILKIRPPNPLIHLKVSGVKENALNGRKVTFFNNF